MRGSFIWRATIAEVMAAPEGFELAGPAHLPTPLGRFQVYAFRHPDLAGDHALLTKGLDGDTDEGPAVLCRIHSACLTGDIFHSLRCDCGSQFDCALEAIEAAGRGVVVYLNQEGRGIGFFNKIRAYVLQDGGHDTVEANELLGLPADARQYAPAADALAALDVHRVRLMTNNPDKVRALEAEGIRVEERVPLHVEIDDTARSYMKTKRDRMGHLLPHHDE